MASKKPPLDRGFRLFVRRVMELAEGEDDPQITLWTTQDDGGLRNSEGLAGAGFWAVEGSGDCLTLFTGNEHDEPSSLSMTSSEALLLAQKLVLHVAGRTFRGDVK